jgi:hypothetical protein
MADLREELDVPIKRRVTIPEGSVAVMLPFATARDLKSMCLLVRKSRRYSAEEKNAMDCIAGHVLLALLDAEDGEPRL